MAQGSAEARAGRCGPNTCLTCQETAEPQPWYLPQGQITLSLAWPEVFAVISQAAPNLGEISIISAGKGGKPRQLRCYGCHRPSSMQHHIKQLCKQMCHSWKAKQFSQL